MKLLTTALNALEPELLDGLELEFVGKTTASWPRERVRGLLSATRRSGALAGSRSRPSSTSTRRSRGSNRPGTLAVMPSLQDNSPNTVYECLEHGIPFIASNVGGVPELIAPEDHARVLFEPTSEGLGEHAQSACSPTETFLRCRDAPSCRRRLSTVGPR